MMRASSESQISQVASELSSSESSKPNFIRRIFVVELIFFVYMTLCTIACISHKFWIFVPFTVWQMVLYIIVLYIFWKSPERTIFSKDFFSLFHGFTAIVEVCCVIFVLSFGGTTWQDGSFVLQKIDETENYNRHVGIAVLVATAAFHTLIVLAINLKFIDDFYPKNVDENPTTKGSTANSTSFTGASDALDSTSYSTASTISSTSFCHHAPSLMNCDCKKTTTSLAAMSQSQPLQTTNFTSSAVYMLPLAPSKWTVISDDYYNSLNDTKGSDWNSFKSSRIGGGGELPTIPEESIYVDVDMR